MPHPYVPPLTAAQLLEIYGLFKQATAGDNTTSAHAPQHTPHHRICRPAVGRAAGGARQVGRLDGAQGCVRWSGSAALTAAGASAEEARRQYLEKANALAAKYA